MLYITKYTSIHIPPSLLAYEGEIGHVVESVSFKMRIVGRAFDGKTVSAMEDQT